MSVIHHSRKNITEESQLPDTPHTKKPEHKSLEALKKNTAILKDRVERLSFMMSEIHSILDSSTSVSRF